jgi:hypothetical protein
MSKNMAEAQGPHDVTIWRIRVACWISKSTYTYSHAHAQACTHTAGHSRTRTHTDRPISNTYCFSTAIMIRERLSVLRCTYNSFVFKSLYLQQYHRAIKRCFCIVVLKLNGTHQLLVYADMLLYWVGAYIL